jgi:aromatic ring-opening dioxygenase catalytic subunit (LigB family)
MPVTPQPSFFIPHGGGPCFFMDDPAGIWTGMEDFLRNLPATLPSNPEAILVISGHWETRGFALTGASRPPLIYDYYNFPPHTYDLTYDVAGAPDLAARAASLLVGHGLEAHVDPVRGLAHGVFIPLMVAFPDADVPVIEMSVERGFDPAQHLAAGHALAPLRDEGVLILGSGMSFHNMQAYGDPGATQRSREFDAWLAETASLAAPERNERLSGWADAPFARFAHPPGREEHLLPLMVAAGAAAQTGTHVYNEEVLETAISGFRF